MKTAGKVRHLGQGFFRQYRMTNITLKSKKYTRRICFDQAYVGGRMGVIASRHMGEE